MSDIQYAYPLILNKVASPHYITPTLRRPRLLDWLHDNAESRAVVIAADAGYGKTTLLWQWEREVDFPCYWYKIDGNDRDWTLHVSYLAESIARRHKGFGRRTHSALQQLGGPGSSRPGVAAYFLAEMHDRLHEPCTFIIDDWQFVNAVTEVRGLWNQILRDAPPTCRFVFASRSKPKLQFARFRTHGGYAELQTDALRFNDREIDDLFRDIYNDPLDPTELTELERRTEGWAASLQLVEVSLRERRTPEARREFIQSITATKDSDLFAFLAEEVLDQQTEGTRNFLLSTAILQQITADLAERLTGTHDGMHQLLDLEQRGLFTQRLDEHRFRYHNLFRDFLERRLVAERTDAEIIGLHIHAASYFETTEQWPEAIHHYLKAGLQRQAARLIAKFGEDVVSEGRLGLVDEWLQQLPEKTIRENARLSLLYGEACGIRGDWERAFEALTRAHAYFVRKGDRRMEALANLKLSSIHANYGRVDDAAEFAQRGLELAPPDAAPTRLRLQGNLAITRIWMTDGLASVINACRRIAVEASALGLEHFASIALHNMGAAQRQMGDLEASAQSLTRAARFWAELPSNPFADNFELVMTLLALGDVDAAGAMATAAERRTAQWARPHLEARMGQAAVLAHQGRFAEAIVMLNELLARRDDLWANNEICGALLLDCLFITRASPASMAQVLQDIDSGPRDPRQEVLVAPARALAAHRTKPCAGECLDAANALHNWDGRGARLLATIGLLKLGLLALEHHERRAAPQALEAIRRVLAAGVGRHMKWWLREYAAHAARVFSRYDGPSVMIALGDLDPDGWRPSLVEALPKVSGSTREELLACIARHATKETVADLAAIAGNDVVEVRRALIHRQAPRLFVRSFGSLAIHRGAWTGPSYGVAKKRLRVLLGLLVSSNGKPLSRDQVLDTMWPEADPAAAVNSLNQTVFQLRRVLDPAYRDGTSPTYLVSTSDVTHLNPELVRTDLSELHRLRDRLKTGSARRGTAEQILDLVRGEFLEELKYEDWAAWIQTPIHSEVRGMLLGIATDPAADLDADLRIRACWAMTTLDDLDEQAHITIARLLSATGRRKAARQVLERYTKRVTDELDEPPSGDLVAARQSVGLAAV